MKTIASENFRYEGELEAALRLQEIVMQVAESEQFTPEMQEEYNGLRRVFLESQTLRESLPEFVASSNSLYSLWQSDSLSKSLAERQRVASDKFAKLLGDTRLYGSSKTIIIGHPAVFEANLPSEGSGTAETARVDSSSWTGIRTRADRIAAAQSLLPSARMALTELMHSLSVHGHNGGPRLDERNNAIGELRKLHDTLGAILDSIDQGRFHDDMGDGLVRDAVRYGKRVTKSLSDDPVPYAVATMIMAIMSACGFPGAGAFLADISLQIGRK